MRTTVSDPRPTDAAGDRPARQYTHPQVNLTFDDEIVPVDVGIAPLLEEIWRALGFCTFNSCQDNGGRIWLHFVRGRRRRCLREHRRQARLGRPRSALRGDS
jgi:hypothetical protein